MGKFDEAIELYTNEMTGKGMVKNVDVEVLKKVCKGLGPALYKSDSQKVACSDKTELERIKTNFLIKKLGMADSEKLDAGIKDVCEQMGRGNRNKWRGIFYYLLVKRFRKSKLYAD